LEFKAYILNHYRKLGGQTLVYGLGNIVPRILNYAVLTVYYTRRFSVQEYGMITELYAYVAVFMVLLTYGMETGLFKFSSGNYDRDKVYTTTLISVVCTSLTFLGFVQFFRKPIAGAIGYAGNPEYIFYLGLALSMDAIGAILFAKLRIENRIRRFAMLKIFNVLITIFFVFLFLEIFPAVRFLTECTWYKLYLKEIEVGYVFIANALASLSVLIFLLKDLKNVQLVWKRSILMPMLAYSVPLLLSGLAGIFNETIDRIIMRGLLPQGRDPLYELGIYGANYRIAVLMTIVIQMFRYAAEPFFFNVYKELDAKVIYANVLKYFTIILMAVFLLVSVGIDFFKYFIDREYHEGLGIVPIVLLANVMIGLLFNVNMWYKLTGKTMYGVYITGIGALIAVLGNVIFIPLYGYKACAWIHLVSNFIMVWMTFWYGQKYYPIHYDLHAIGIYIGTAIGLYGLWTLLRNENDFFNLTIGAIFVMVYLFFCNHREKLFVIFFSSHESKDNQSFKA
jgi:O-antigen/teichoic acid export membrane protein